MDMTYEECIQALARFKEAQLRFLDILENKDHPSHTSIQISIKLAVDLHPEMSQFQIIYNLMIGYARKELYGFSS